MLETFVDCDSLLDIDCQHTIDEVESRIADGVPIRRGIVEAAHLDLLSETVGIITGIQLIREWWEATKANV